MKRHNNGMAKLERSFVFKILLIGAVAFFVLNYDVSMGLVRLVGKALRPIFIGIIFALILNLPLTLFEKKVYKKVKSPKLNKALSMASTVSIVILFFVIMINLIVPQIIASSEDLVNNIKTFAEKNFTEDNQIYLWIINNLQDYLGDITETIKGMLPNIMDYTGRIFRAVIDLFIGLFLAILILASRDTLLNQFKKFLHYEFAQGRVIKLIAAFNLAIYKFSRYLGGQLLEAILFGTVCYIGLIILRIPYAPLIAVIMGVVNVIPMVGAYIGAFISVILIFSVDPMKALVFIIFTTALQQIEGVTTYPIIIGRNIGLNAFWILASIVVGGTLFGFIGIFLGVPTVAFLHDYISQLIKLDLEEKEREKEELKKLEGNEKDILEAIEDLKEKALESKIIID